MKLLMTIGIGLLSTCALIAHAASPAYHVAREAPVAGDDGWDYLNADPASGRLFVTHGSKIQVLNLNDLSAVGEIADIQGAHGVAPAPDLGRGYITSGRSDSIVVFDLRTLERLQEIKATGGNPDAILYDAATHQLFTFNGRGRNATVFDARSNAVIATIDLHAKPEFSVDDLAGRVYVNLEDSHSLAVIDAATRSVQKTWQLPGCEEPTGLAIDRPHRRLFSTCSNKILLVIDAASGRIVTRLPIGERVDGVAFDPATGLAFASGGDGTMTVVHEETPERFAVVQTARTRAGARTVTVDEKSHRIYTVTAKRSENETKDGRPVIVPGSFAVLMLEQ